jgi:hypothetical protein
MHYVYYANTKGKAKNVCQDELSLIDLSLNIIIGIINPMNFKNLGQIIPDRCVPTLDRYKWWIITSYSQKNSPNPSHGSLPGSTLLT